MLVPGIEPEITIAEAARSLPGRNGKRVHVLTVKRWIIKGCRGVKLAGWKRGDRWYTSLAAIEQFRQDCTAKAGRSTIQIDSPAAFAKRVASARESLRQRGFYGGRQPPASRSPQS